MKRIGLPVLAFATVLAVVLSSSPLARAQEDVFKAKCAACHGADGTGSKMGKTMGVHDWTSAEVQKMSDADLAATITNGKNKMPKYPAVDTKAMVAYIRTLKK